jgi:hypothetical protein
MAQMNDLAEMQQRYYETLVKNFSRCDLPLSTLSSLAGIVSAYSMYKSYSGVLTDNSALITAIVFIILQSILTCTNLFVMVYMWWNKLYHYEYTMKFAVCFELIDMLLEIIIVILLCKVKVDYDKEYSRVMANVVQSTALLISNKHNSDTQFVFTLILGVFSAFEDAYELYHVI